MSVDMGNSDVVLPGRIKEKYKRFENDCYFGKKN
jgi:hypothetical protein